MSLEDAAEHRQLWSSGNAEAASCKAAADAWRAAVPTLPSLIDAYDEAE